MLDAVGERLMAALPKDIESTILNRFRHGEEGEQPPTEILPEDETTTGATGYNRTERRGLDQLIQNSGAN
jgi:hypothetical protein